MGTDYLQGKHSLTLCVDCAALLTDLTLTGKFYSFIFCCVTITLIGGEQTET